MLHLENDNWTTHKKYTMDNAKAFIKKQALYIKSSLPKPSENAAVMDSNNIQHRRLPVSRNICNNQWIPNAIPKEYMLKLYQAFDTLPRHYCFQKENTNGTRTLWAEFIIDRNKLIFMTQYYLALRPKEAIALRWDDILNEHSIYIRAENNKVKKSRIAQMPEKLSEAMIAYKKKYRYIIHSPWLFPTFDKGRQSHISRYRWGEIFHTVIKLVGLDRIDPRDPRRCMYTPYSLRHSRATHLLEDSNFDIFTVSNILGHGSIEITMTYLHICPSIQDHFNTLISQNLPF